MFKRKKEEAPEPWTHTKFRQILLMMGSTHDGEVLAAVKALRNYIEDRGFSLHDLANRIAEAPAAEPKKDGRWEPPPRDKAYERRQGFDPNAKPRSASWDKPTAQEIRRVMEILKANHHHVHGETSWEFVGQMIDRYAEWGDKILLSEKQWDWLLSLAQKVKR